MFGYDWPRFHAAVNDLPAALLFVTVLFDIGAWLTKRESLKAAALWTLWAGVIGGGVAGNARPPTGDGIEQGGAGPQLVGEHETPPPPPPRHLTLPLRGETLFRPPPP